MDPIIINLVCSVLVAVITSAVFIRTMRNESKNDGKNDGFISSELGYVKKGIDDINLKLEKQEDRFVELAQRVSSVESSAKQAHKRIDQMTGSRYQGEENHEN